jgi:LacI family transcriptional regulator
MKSYITLRDIAEKAGVSINSVSRALKDREDIGADTKNTIKRIAQELGYIPHAAASNLRSGVSKSIGVIVTRIDNPFFSRILQGVNDCVSERGYTVITISSNEDIVTERRAITLLTSYRTSGMLIVPANDLESDLDYASIQPPHIQIVRPGRSSSGNSFVSNSRRSGELAAERLLSLGRNRLGYLGFRLPVSCDMERFSGYAAKTRNAGLDLLTHRIRKSDATSEAAYTLMMEWIKDGFDADGIFIYNDMMAFGALRAFSDSGIRVPEDVSVVGHDDIEVSQSFIPRLTTIQVPKYRLGFESAQALLGLIEQGRVPAPEQRVVYEPELVVRET